MTEILDLRTGLAAALADRAVAWRFIEAFAADWREPLKAGDGWTGAELDAAEQRLGLRLPAALREAYELFGRRDDLTRNQDQLLRPDDLYVADGALVYHVENQDCAYWGILLTDLHHDDPRTVTRPDLADKSQERWEPWADSFSAACVELVMSETVLYEDGLTDISEPPPESIETYTALPSPLPAERGSRWFTGPEVLLHLYDDAWLCVRARSEEALDSLREELPGDWLNA